MLLFTRVMYSRAKSYGGVKGRAPHAGTGKRSVAAAAGMAAARAAMKAQNRAVSGVYTARRSTGETKYFDTSFSQTVAVAADWTGTEVPCTNYIQSDGTTLGAYTDSALIPSAIGAGFGQANGSKYVIKKVRVRGEVVGTVASDQADVPIPNTVRICLIQDTRPNGSQAQGEDVFADMGSAGQNNFNFLAMGAGNGSRFRILADEWVTLQPAVAGTDGANTNSTVRTGALFSFMWKPKKPVEVFLKANSSTPTVASLSSCNVFLLAHAASSTVALNGCARCYYVD